ncbi:MAG: peptidoglycan DD-metalloendopeptidase family protein [Bacteroides sp.]|nr:peptidoglycan DD-metalloendopeptidase family protein [Eubacterium sp.]MCM1417738.1 peptidoglycan DD-metalloendopeptidase family protein [Roseburia sp.]MCM1461371.1 peptidoglycan DD-metalloendopeptidase family protein [Bacteroides sp.]
MDSENTAAKPEDTAAPKKAAALKNASAVAALFLSRFGRYICSVSVLLLIHLGKNLLRFFRMIWERLRLLRRATARGLSYLGVLIASPFLSFRNAFSRTKEAYRAAKETGGTPAALRAAGNVLGDFIFGKSGIAVSLFNIAAPIVCAVFFFNIVAYAGSLNYAVKLVVNDKFLGYIENEQVYYDAEAILKERINYLGSNESIRLEPEFSIALIESPDTLTKFRVADKMLEYSDLTVDYAYGFYLNGSFMGAMFDNTEVKATLEGILDRYRAVYPNAEVAFEDRIECDTGGLYLSGSIIDTDWLISQLTGVQRQAGYYIVEDGDSHSLICDKLNLTMAQLELLNPGFADMELHGGDRIKSRDEIPFLSVGVTVMENYELYVDYDTEYYYDDTLYVGVSRTTTPGEKGVNSVTARVTYVNSIETKREITYTAIVSRPVTERIAQGTKPTPESLYSPEDAGYGKFIWPTEGGGISEPTFWDGGYSGHLGVDIVAYYGAPIFAGASGTVVYAGSNYGFGNHVIIDHGDGVQTLYAHCSALYVTVGQQVTQGEFIAAMGATGWAQGTHVHFEVIVNGINKNPVDYLESIRWSR